MELPSSFLNAFTLHPGSTTMTASGRQSSSAPRARTASIRRSACASVMAVIGPPGSWRWMRVPPAYAGANRVPSWLTPQLQAVTPVCDIGAGHLIEEVTNGGILTPRHAGRRRGRRHGGSCNGHGDVRTGSAVVWADADTACRHRA